MNSIQTEVQETENRKRNTEINPNVTGRQLTCHRESLATALRGSDISQAPHLTSLFWPRLNISFHAYSVTGTRIREMSRNNNSFREGEKKKAITTRQRQDK